MIDRLRAALALALLVCSAAATALSPTLPLNSLRQQTWQTVTGMPDLHTMAMTADGWFWFGSVSGLYRFDGQSFERFDLPRDPRLPSQSVLWIYAPRTGGLWISFVFGGLAFLEHGKTTFYPTSDGGGRLAGVKSMAQTPDGTLWLSNPEGVFRFDGTAWRNADAQGKYPAGAIATVACDSDGSLWAYGDQVAWVLRKSGQAFEGPSKIDAHRVWATVELPNGQVWGEVGNGPALLHLHDSQTPGHPRTNGSQIALDRHGGLWLSFGRFAQLNDATDLARLTLKEMQQVKHEGGFWGVLEDREGNVWRLSTDNLRRFSEPVVQEYDIPDPHMVMPPALIVDEAGTLWLGSHGKDQSLWSMSPAGKWTEQPVGDIYATARGANGDVWFGGRSGIRHYANGRFETFPLPEAAANRLEVAALADDGHGGVWVSILREGLYHLKDGAWTKGGGLPNFEPGRATSLARDAQGTLWIGLPNGIQSVQGREVRKFGPEQGITIGPVISLYTQRGTIWAGGEFGLLRFDGRRFVQLLAADSSALRFISGIVETAEGDLWLNGSSGVVHISASEVRRARADPSYRVEIEPFGAADGVLGTAGRISPAPTIVEGHEGQLWMLTSALYMIDTAHRKTNPVAPPVQILGVSGDGQALAVMPEAAVRLPERTGLVEFKYLGLSLTAPEKVHYRYRLEGVDKAWQEAGTRRQVSYANLSPGTYKFRVIAANSDGVWNEAGATTEIVLPAAFTQTRWFAVLCALVAALLIWGMLHLRTRQVEGRMRARHRVRLAERERIARELHDTLLQSTQGMVMMVGAAITQLRNGHAAADLLTNAAKAGEDALVEARERIHELRREEGETVDIGAELLAIGRRLASEPDAPAFELHGEAQPAPFELGREIVSVGREALLNAYRHARAQSVKVELSGSGGDLLLRVSDDGKGLDGEVSELGATPGHWGLPGMRERARQMGASLHVESSAGRGTTVELRLAKTATEQNGARRKSRTEVRDLEAVDP